MGDTTNYFLAEIQADAESVRLGVLERCFDPGTIRRLDGLNIAPGSRCLEVGAGRGSIARWLSAKVGPDGTVVAADIDTRFLRELPGNVEVRQLDIRIDDLEPDSYDVVHCRALLMHLPDPLDVLRRMAAALRPGGVLLAEEADCAMQNYGGHPDAGWATATTHRIWDGLASAKIANFYFGRGLGGLLCDAGLEVLGGGLGGSVCRLGDPRFDLWRLGLENMAPGLITAGLLTEDDAARLQRVMSSPATVLTTLVLVAAWARRMR